MADIPDQTVMRRVENVMDRHGELDDAEARTEMPAGHGDGIDCLVAQLVGELSQFGFLQLAQVGRQFDLVQ